MPHRQAKRPHKIEDRATTSRAESLPALLETYYAALRETVEEKTGKKSRGSASYIRSVGRGVRTLQRGLTGARTLAGSGYFSSDAFLEAYLLYYWPISFVETYLALTELEARGVPLPAGRILDLGAGPGPASFACSEFFGVALDTAAPDTAALGGAIAGGGTAVRDGAVTGGAPEFGSTLIDANGNALAMAGKIAALLARQRRADAGSGVKKGSAPPPRLTYIEYDLQNAGIGGKGQNVSRSAEFSRFLDTEAPGPYSIIVACHCLNELWQDQSEAYAVEWRAGLLRQACEALQDGGILLVIEPAAAIEGRPALMVRDRLLSDAVGFTDETAEEGAATAATIGPIATAGTATSAESPSSHFRFSCIGPCTGSFACPAIASGNDRSCHSTWPWAVTGTLAELAAEAGLDRDSAKATWFALRKSAVAAESPANTPWPHEETPAAACAATRHASSTSAALYSPQTSGAALRGRVISEALLNKAGRIRYIFCTASGLATVSANAANERAKNLDFFTLERGDVVELQNLEIRPGERNFGIADGTELSFIVKIPRVGRI